MKSNLVKLGIFGLWTATVLVCAPQPTKALAPNDPLYPNQWYLTRIQAEPAWDIANASPEIIVAVIDSGVDINNPDLKNNLWTNPREIIGNKKDDDRNGYVDDLHGWDFVNNSANVQPKFAKNYTAEGIVHGTVIAGIIAGNGNNGQGITGITWQAKIMALKALNDQGQGDNANIIKAVNYAVDNGADIINLSFVGTGYNQKLEAALRRAKTAGVIVVAAAGNEKGSGGVSLEKNPMYPVCLDGRSGENLVLGVAATDAMDEKAVFSGYGKKCIDLSAPGVSIFSTSVYAPTKSYPGRKFDGYYDGFWSGTSAAAPMVSGALALLAGFNPELTVNQAIALLLNNTDNIEALNPRYQQQLGRGRLNLYKALSAAQVGLTEKNTKIILAAASASPSLVSIIDRSGWIYHQFMAFEDKYTGGVNLASGDVNKDGLEEIVAAPAGLPAQAGAHSNVVKIFDINGKLLKQFTADSCQKGTNLTVGDINNDNQAEIITAPGYGCAGEVKVFNNAGKLLRHFYPYETNFKGGVNLAIGRLDNNSLSKKLIIAPGSGRSALIKIYDQNYRLTASWLAFDKKNLSGARVVAANIDRSIRRNGEEILVAPAGPSRSQIKIFTVSGGLRNQFDAYDQAYPGGLVLAVGDFDQDGLKEIAVEPGRGGEPTLRIFESNGDLLDSFLTAADYFRGGINLATINIKN